MKCEEIDVMIAKECVIHPIYQLGWWTINRQYSQILLLLWLRFLTVCNFVALDSDELDFLEFVNDIWSNHTICLETVT